MTKIIINNVIYKGGIININRFILFITTFFILLICFTMLIVSCSSQGNSQEIEMTGLIDVETNDTTDINDIQVETTIETTVEAETTQTVEDDTESNELEDTTSFDENTIAVTPLFHLSNYERGVVECIVMGESGNEPYAGQLLVTECILNACLKENMQPSEIRIKYKYSGWSEKVTESVREAVSQVFDEGYLPVDDFILYFYAPQYAEGKWHETQRFVIEVGGHRFFAEWD